MPEPPTFSNYEEMLAFLENQNQTPKKNKPKKRSPRKKAHKGNSPEQIIPEDAQLQQEFKLIWKTEHYFIRDKDTWESTLKDAKFSLTRINPSNTLVFAHNHTFGVECNPRCREVISE